MDKTADFIVAAHKVHGDRYGYDKARYTKSKIGIEIKCPVHGYFKQIAHSHLKGMGCHKCAGMQRAIAQKTRSAQVIIARFKKIHGDRYDYSESIYNGAENKIDIRCKMHGIFSQKVAHHLNGHGCNKCARDDSGLARRRAAADDFTNKAIAIHGDKYSYDQVKYTHSQAKVAIYCRSHKQRFMQVPNKHLSGRGCPLCANDATAVRKLLTTSDFIAQARLLHGDKYDYSNSEYLGCDKRVEIACPDHGVFWQEAQVHSLMGCGCPKCIAGSSRGEVEVADFIKSLGFEIACEDRSIIAPYHLDIVIPSRKLAVEYNGNYWHSENHGRGRRYHIDKLNAAERAGYRLIMVREDEWQFKQEIVKSIIANALGKTKQRIGARKCGIRLLDKGEYAAFMDDNHLQGALGATVRIGLVYKGELVSAIGITEFGRGAELTRFASRKGLTVNGALSKMLKVYGKRLRSYCDRRIFTGAGYEASGFKMIKLTDPDFFYINSRGETRTRYTMQKSKLHKVLKKFDPSLSELKNTRANGWLRVWGCGHLLLEWSPQQK